MNLIENDNRSEYPIFIWVDKNIFNWENRINCEQLQNDYQNLFQAFDNISDALKILNKIKDKDVTILTSAQCAYQLVKQTKKNMIVFCGTKFYHLNLFLDNTQIKSIVSNSFQSAHEDVIMSMNQTDIYNDFIKLLSPPQQQAIEYQHSKDHVSIQFLVVIEDIRKNKEPEESDIYNEIEALLNISNKQQKKQNILEDLQKKEIEKEQLLKEKFNLFEKLIYLYSREEIYQVFNQQFAQHNYQKIKNIILCLYQGFKQLKEYKFFSSLFRGIYFDSKEIFETIIQDLQSSQMEGKSLFWNTITSTSLLSEIAYNFCSSCNYGILYQILLDQDVPHPCFKLQAYHTQYPKEEEVLLFPQFEFIVQEINCIQVEPITIYLVTIKQVKNNYAFALDPMLRKIYWDKIKEEKIKPKIETLVNFQSKRIFELISFFAEEFKDQEIYMDEILYRIENELVNVFGQIQMQLTKILSHSNYTDVLSQIEKLTKTYTQVIKIEYQNQNPQQFFQSIEELIDKVIKSLRQNICTLILKGIINIEYWKEYLENLQAKLKMKQSQNSTIAVPNSQKVDPSSLQSQPVYKGNTSLLSYQQLKGQKITSLQQVQHKNGNFAYEATLQDGNKLLMHHNPNNNNELTFTKKIDATGKNGYSNKWQKVGKPLETKSITVQEVQQSIQGQSEKFNMQSIQAKEMNYQIQQAKISGQIGGVIAGTLGSLTVDCIIDGIDAQKLGKGLLASATIQGGLIYAQSVQSFGRAVPYVGIGLTAFMTSISVGGVILSDFLSQSEKVYNSMLIAVKTGSAIGLGYFGIEGGMALGATSGPIGVVIGGIIGGFIGGASGNLLGRAIDHFTQFTLQVDFNKNHKSKVEDGYLINPGQLPKINWKYVKDKVKSLILIAQTDTHMACLIPNIDRNRTEIQENEDIGIQFNEYKYIGPDDSCKSITFRLLATTEEYVNDDEILQQLQNNETNIIDIAQVKINLENIKQ
ncbi:unnamed protein product [Paramecium primaurelia]|uniref:NAD(+)--protein-arginine ADP-ribosyltransferase n=1 Tax=Paramecium primaurelia TaxID=5886 RepID=A0A8S1N4M3_PARPR|nr:unnamed protein product [Paramecium primaurelia]